MVEIIIIETIPGVEIIIDPIPVIVTTNILRMVEREDVQMIGIEIEMTTTAMIGLTDAGPVTMTIMMIDTRNVEGSMMIENDLGLLTIGTTVRNLVMNNHQNHPQGLLSLYLSSFTKLFRDPSPVLTEEERDLRTVFVQQLAARLRTKELVKFFEKAGPVREAQIVKDRVSGRSKG
jgi:hypothetical protein